MKPLVIYHKGCMDGAGAALAAWLRFGEEAEYRPASYGDPAPTSEEVRGRDVYVLDFSYPRAELVRIARAVNDGIEPPAHLVCVLDHHKTAQKELDGLEFCTFNMNKSGAVLAWEHFHVGWGKPDSRRMYALPELFAYIQDRDLWRWELPHSKEISAALFATGATEDFRKLAPIYRNWSATRNGTWGDAANALIRAREAILATEKQMIARAVATAEQVALDGHKCLAVSCPVLQSEIGEALAIESAQRGLSPIGVIWHRHGDKGGVYRVSLRSRDITYVMANPGNRAKLQAPDVSAIAKKLDPKGGGHHHAAGFECARLPWDRTVDEVRAYIRDEWCTDDRMNAFELQEKRQQDDLLLARIGATMEEINKS